MLFEITSALLIIPPALENGSYDKVLFCNGCLSTLSKHKCSFRNCATLNILTTEYLNSKRMDSSGNLYVLKLSSKLCMVNQEKQGILHLLNSTSLISLWFPSICHSVLGLITLSCRLSVKCSHRITVPSGSTLLILSLTRVC